MTDTIIIKNFKITHNTLWRQADGMYVEKSISKYFMLIHSITPLKKG